MVFRYRVSPPLYVEELVQTDPGAKEVYSRDRANQLTLDQQVSDVVRSVLCLSRAGAIVKVEYPPRGRSRPQTAQKVIVSSSLKTLTLGELFCSLKPNKVKIEVTFMSVNYSNGRPSALDCSCVSGH